MQVGTSKTYDLSRTLVPSISEIINMYLLNPKEWKDVFVKVKYYFDNTASWTTNNCRALIGQVKNGFAWVTMLVCILDGVFKIIFKPQNNVMQFVITRVA